MEIDHIRGSILLALSFFTPRTYSFVAPLSGRTIMQKYKKSFPGGVGVNLYKGRCW